MTDGPYAETVEQLSGFYLVETDDLDDLVEVTKILADAEGGIEIRACSTTRATPREVRGPAGRDGQLRAVGGAHR